MDSKRIHILFVSHILSKQLCRELYAWKLKTVLKSKSLNANRREINRKQDIIMYNSLQKLNSTCQGSFTPIFESQNERSPSPPLNIFEELKSSLKNKVLKVEPIVRAAAKERLIQGVHKIDSTQELCSPKKNLSTDIVRSSPALKKISKFSATSSVSFSKLQTSKAKEQVTCSNKQILKK